MKSKSTSKLSRKTFTKKNPNFKMNYNTCLNKLQTCRTKLITSRDSSEKLKSKKKLQTVS